MDVMVSEDRINAWLQILKKNLLVFLNLTADQNFYPISEMD